MNRLHNFVMAGAAAILLAAGGDAQAVLVGPGDLYTFSWNRTFPDGSGLQHTFSGTGSMTLSGFNSSSLSLSITLNNTSPAGGPNGTRLVSFGFAIDPNASSVGFVDAVDGGMVAAQLGGGSLGSNVEICVWGGLSCDDGSTGGIFGGETDVFTVVLGGIFGSVVDIEPAVLRYQSLFLGAIFGADSATVGPPPAAVPEPGSGSLALLAVGLLASVIRRRHNNAIV